MTVESDKPLFTCPCTVYYPSGKINYDFYTDAVEAIKLAHPMAVQIHRWCDRQYSYEDFRTKEGGTVAQIQTTGYPPMLNSFEYV